mmetsp:Transcript_25300/g.57097  ORF Transcript_25300/g.57097 Transcript_25300/m.57097 type:complete len:303 (+) Transcript_25300:44-952(+)
MSLLHAKGRSLCCVCPMDSSNGAVSSRKVLCGTPPEAPCGALHKSNSPLVRPYLEEAAASTDAEGGAVVRLGIPAVVKQVPPGRHVLWDVPGDGHYAGRDADSLPLKRRLKVVVVRHDCPMLGSHCIALIFFHPSPHRSKTTVAPQVIPRVRSPELHPGPGAGEVGSGGHVLLDLPELTSHRRVVVQDSCLALGHAHTSRKRGRHARENVLAILIDVLRHLDQEVRHGLVCVGAEGSKAAFVALVLILLEGGDVARIAARHIVQHHDPRLVQQALPDKNLLDCLPGSLPGHRRELSRDSDDH